jgi:uncharacterized DUF497 family protein
VSYDLDIDEGNNGKCQSHGVSIRELYQMFAKSVSTFTIGRTADEERAIAIGTMRVGTSTSCLRGVAISFGQ